MTLCTKSEKNSFWWLRYRVHKCYANGQVATPNYIVEFLVTLSGLNYITDHHVFLHTFHLQKKHCSQQTRNAEMTTFTQVKSRTKSS